jgi:hypothetical protein
LGFSRPLIHATACICGSMMSGKRAHLWMLDAFCVESGSAGSPSACQPAVFDESVSRFIGSTCSRFIGSKPAVSGTPRASMSGMLRS